MKACGQGPKPEVSPRDSIEPDSPAAGKSESIIMILVWAATEFRAVGVTVPTLQRASQPARVSSYPRSHDSAPGRKPRRAA